MNKDRILSLLGMLLLSVSLLQSCSDSLEPATDVNKNSSAPSYEQDIELLKPYLEASEKGYVLKYLSLLDLEPIPISSFRKEVIPSDVSTKAEIPSIRIILAELAITSDDDIAVTFESNTSTVYCEINIVGKDFIIMGFSGTTLSYVVFPSTSNSSYMTTKEWEHRGNRNMNGKYQWAFVCNNGVSGSISFFEDMEIAPSDDASDSSPKPKRVLYTQPHTPWPAEPLK
jgi:hypothetical protein